MHGHLDDITSGVSYDGYTSYIVNGIGSNLAPIYVFSFNTSNTHAGMRLYSLKMFKSNVLVANYIPCYYTDNGNDVIGIYDTVSGEFMAGAGSGSFIKGNDIS